jgi:hypothetical protein
LEKQMRDGGKGDAKRKLVVPEEVFNNNWDTIFGKKSLVEQAPYHPGYEDAVSPQMVKNLEPIPFAGMVDTGDDDVSK